MICILKDIILFQQDGLSYLQPKIIDPQLVAQHVNQAINGIAYNPENERFNKDQKLHSKKFARPTEQITCGSSTDIFKQVYNNDNNYDCDCNDDLIADCEVYICKIYSIICLLSP